MRRTTVNIDRPILQDLKRLQKREKKNPANFEATVDARLRHDGQTGLHWAAYGGHADTVKLLLERGAPVGAKDASYSGTPLEWALYASGNFTEREAERRRHYEVAALLRGS